MIPVLLQEILDLMVQLGTLGAKIATAKEEQHADIVQESAVSFEAYKAAVKELMDSIKADDAAAMKIIDEIDTKPG